MSSKDGTTQRSEDGDRLAYLEALGLLEIHEDEAAHAEEAAEGDTDDRTSHAAHPHAAHTHLLRRQVGARQPEARCERLNSACADCAANVAHNLAIRGRRERRESKRHADRVVDQIARLNHHQVVDAAKPNHRHRHRDRMTTQLLQCWLRR